MATTFQNTGGLSTEEKRTAPFGGYSASQFVQAPSGRAGFVDQSFAASAGDPVTIRTSGCGSLPCDTAITASIGDEAWWDDTNQTVVKSPVAGGWRAGFFHAAKTSGQTTAVIELNAVRYDPGVLTKTADYTLTVGQSGAVVTNTGASGAVVITLPPAVPGLTYTGAVSTAQALRFDPDGTETISLPSTGVPGAAGKYLTCSTVGCTVVLRCVKAGNWVVVGYTGTWTAEP